MNHETSQTMEEKVHTAKAKKQGESGLVIWRTLHHIRGEYRVDVFLEILLLKLFSYAVQGWIDNAVRG